jgi:hypothetical protein
MLQFEALKVASFFNLVLAAKLLRPAINCRPVTIAGTASNSCQARFFRQIFLCAHTGADFDRENGVGGSPATAKLNMLVAAELALCGKSCRQRV